MNTIAIIDDGIYGYNDLVFNLKISNDLKIENFQKNNHIIKSHGTVCAEIIKKYYERAEIGSIKILNDSKANKDQLITAIKWCSDRGIKLINLSIGTVWYKDFEEISKCIEYAYNNGVIIVAALNNSNFYTCPASLDKTIGVICDRSNSLKDNQYCYISENNRCLNGVNIVANARHEIYSNNNMINYTYPCNSYAAPLITAIVGNFIDKNSELSFHEVKEYLKRNSVQYNIYQPYSLNGKKIDEIPVVLIYEDRFKGKDGLGIYLCKAFRGMDYNAILVDNNIIASDILQGVVALNDFYKFNKDININDFIKLTCYTFQCDILIICSDNVLLQKMHGFVLENIFDVVILPTNKKKIENSYHIVNTGFSDRKNHINIRKEEVFNYVLNIFK